MILKVDEVRTFEASVTMEELSLEFDGVKYFVIYGHHAKGAFIAIPNNSISCDASTPDDISSNFEFLHMAGIPKVHAAIIANAIKVFAELREAGQVSMDELKRALTIRV